MEWGAVSARMQAAGVLYGPTDLTRLNWAEEAHLLPEVFGVTSLDDWALVQASPIAYVSTDDPPFLIVQGDRDAVVPNETAVEFDRRLKEAGVPSQLGRVKDGRYHWEGLRITGDDPTRAEVAIVLADLFDKYLK